MKESFRAFIIEKWVPALRSGEYTQGVDRLKDHTDYCCLGVACDLVDGGEWVPLHEGSEQETFVYKGERVLTALPLPLAEEWGIHSAGDIYLVRGKEDIFQFRNEGVYWLNLIDANDLARWSFDKIADLLENMASDTPSYEFRSWSDQW